MGPPRRTRTVPWGIVGLTSGAVVVLGSVVALRARSADPAAEPAGSIAASASPIGAVPTTADLALPAPVTSTVLTPPTEARRQILSKTSLEDAIAVARPQMVNTVGRLDTGSALLALWAVGHLSWDMLEALPATSAAMFQKDPEAERGKRLCVTGTIVEIRAERSLAARLVDNRTVPLITLRPPPALPSDPPGRLPEPSGTSLDAVATAPDWVLPDDGKVFIATLREKAPASDNAGRTFRKPNRDELVVEVIAAKSSGQLVNRSEARACGVLSGVTLPSTSNTSLPADLTEHRIVGMFDLPQNRAAH